MISMRPQWTGASAVQSRVPSLVPLIEAVPVAEVFATGVAEVEHYGEFVRLTFFSEHTTVDGEHERIIVARLVMPHVAYHIMARKLTETPMRLA